MDPHAADDALERMAFGAPVADEWRDVASFVRELQEAIPSADLASEDLHVAAMVETAQLLADKGDPVVRPVSNAAEPAPQASGLPKQRRKSMKKRMAARILAPIAAVFVVFGGMAYAGALPWSGHDQAPASTLSPSDEDSQGALGEDDQGEDTNAQSDEGNNDAVTPPADEGDQGENADDQGDSSVEATSDDQGENDDNQGDNDNQGEDSQGDSTDQQSGDDQGDSTGGDSTSGGDQGGDSSSGGDQGGNSQD